MIEYIYHDLLFATGYLPYGLVVGIPLAAVLMWAVNRRNGDRKPAALLPGAVFGIYFAVMFVITFLSRESGSRKGVVDLELFSTWGINARNNAFVVENVLLFIPYGFFACLAFRWKKRLLCCGFLGACTGLGIECLQLITRRGYFQIDDILTNILGTLIGWGLFRLIFWRKQ